VNTLLERNINLYPKYRAAADAMAWLPVFFLFFSERLTLSEVLLLESIYYLVVVIAEVPSGYMSDLFGRRRTLLLSCSAIFLAYIFFLISDKFAGFAVGQSLLALGMALRSGTDTAFHYESLQSINRQDEYGEREAVAGKYGFAATAMAALAGGILGSFDLALAYWLSLLTASASVYVVFCFVEPGKNTYGKSSNKNSAAASTHFGNQLQDCAAYLKQPFIAWIFAYTVFMFAIVHVPFELYQPYLSLLEQQNQLAGIDAPLVAGVLFALTAVVAAIVSAYSMKWQNLIGLMPLLKRAAIIELAIIIAMAILLHPLIAATLILRSGPMAVIQAPVNAALAPLIANAHRATFLSIKSLASRLVFAIVLIGFSVLTASSHGTDWSSLSLVLRIASITGVIGLACLYLASRNLDDE